MSMMTDQPEPSRLLKPISEKAFALLGDETRRKIIFLLRDNELTVKEIASKLELTTQNIYHHIRRLQEAGLVQVIDERRAGHLIESYYTVTADTFIYNEDRMEERGFQSSIDIMNGLNELGFGVEVSEENAERLSELIEMRIRTPSAPSVEEGICFYCSFSGYFMKFGPMNPVLLSRILQYASLIEMSDEELEAYLDYVREFREFLISIRS
ncbi:MAG: winged helix-turn-helix transcriptional regulator [Candidatus Bathyarchaeota archaeon]|nr:MAG: winged helix-turn-helix transcriptional regulator [Candidatus Bathyarchaeota archaeon]